MARYLNCAIRDRFCERCSVIVVGELDASRALVTNQYKGINTDMGGGFCGCPENVCFDLYIYIYLGVEVTTDPTKHRRVYCNTI